MLVSGALLDDLPLGLHQDRVQGLLEHPLLHPVPHLLLGQGAEVGGHLFVLGLGEVGPGHVLPQRRHPQRADHAHARVGPRVAPRGPEVVVVVTRGGPEVGVGVGVARAQGRLLGAEAHCGEEGLRLDLGGLPIHPRPQGLEEGPDLLKLGHVCLVMRVLEVSHGWRVGIY